MILTVTLNPSIDISYKLPDFKLDTVNRCEDVIKTAGGKGLNVARVLKQIGGDVSCTGFVGGHLGNFIIDSLNSSNIDNDFVKINSQTRNCISIVDGNSQTEILESGPTISQEEKKLFLIKYKTLTSKSKVVTISGSNPKGIANDFVEKLIKISKENNCLTILDVSGNLLKDSILNFKVKPDVIKPNIDEFSNFIDKKIEDIDIKNELINNAKDIQIIFLTCGKNGSYIRKDDKVYKIAIPKVKVVNPTGSGDATVAGIAYSLYKEKNLTYMAKLANALGISNAMNQKTGSVNVDDIDNLMDKITINTI